MAAILGMLGLDTGDLQAQVEDFIKKFNTLSIVERQNNIMLRYLCLQLLPEKTRNEMHLRLKAIEG